MASLLRDRLAAAEAERDGYEAEVNRLSALVLSLRAEVDGLQATVDEDTVYFARSENWLARATAAEDELTALRKELHEFVASLRDVTHGGVVDFRRDIAARLEQILGA